MERSARKKQLLELVGWNLKRLRTSQMKSQETVALEAALDTAYLSRMERALENPTIDALDRVAAALGVELCDLLAPRKLSAKPLQNMKAGRKIDPQSKRQRSLAVGRRRTSKV